jgi:DNA-binding PadR family transcriptional regulator
MRTELTEMEHCVLGVIWRDGPLTAYEIAALFSRSLSPYWSGSAGAIYPVVGRLRKRGLVRGVRRAWNGAQKTVLSITDAGTDLLRAWLAPPLPAGVAAPSYDPIRTRLFFIDVLPAARKLRFLDEAERAVREQLAATKRQHDLEVTAGNTSEAIGSLGVMLELKARLRWLRAVRGWVA